MKGKGRGSLSEAERPLIKASFVVGRLFLFIFPFLHLFQALRDGEGKDEETIDGWIPGQILRFPLFFDFKCKKEKRKRERESDGESNNRLMRRQAKASPSTS